VASSSGSAPASSSASAKVLTQPGRGVGEVLGQAELVLRPAGLFNSLVWSLSVRIE
jgi:hypothetical protein